MPQVMICREIYETKNILYKKAIKISRHFQSTHFVI